MPWQDNAARGKPLDVSQPLVFVFLRKAQKLWWLRNFRSTSWTVQQNLSATRLEERRSTNEIWKLTIWTGQPARSKIEVRMRQVAKLCIFYNTVRSGLKIDQKTRKNAIFLKGRVKSQVGYHFENLDEVTQKVVWLVQKKFEPTGVKSKI